MTSDTLSGIRVLVVEDEAIIAMDLEYGLESAGADVLGPAVSNAEAEAHIATALEGDGLDVVLLDYNLLDGEAGPTARCALEQGVRVVFHSGHASREKLDSQFPGCVLLSKPTPMDGIVGAVLNAARKSEEAAPAADRALRS